MGRGDDEGNNNRLPGKLRSPFGPKKEKERERIIFGKLRGDRFGDMGRRADDGDNVKDVNHPDTPKTFDDVLKDFVVFTVLLNQLDPTSCDKSALNMDKPLDRAKKSYKQCQKIRG